MGCKSRGNYAVKISFCRTCGKVIRNRYKRTCDECKIWEREWVKLGSEPRKK